MRSIGKRNTKLVKGLTIEACEKGLHGVDVRDYVFDKLPSPIFETWEMAYQEIDGLIYDTQVGYAHGEYDKKRIRVNRYGRQT